MIGKLIGIIDDIYDDSVIVNVTGVGYSVFVSSRISQTLILGNTISLYVETHVREDHIYLFGFLSIAEKGAFLALTSVNGVGPKAALAILSILTPEQLQITLHMQDKAAFTQVSGIGPKLAERIVTELKNKTICNISRYTSSTMHNTNANLNDAISALINLGVSHNEALQYANVVIAKNANSSADQIIKQVLQLRARV